jgi:hypothetical protein
LDGLADLDKLDWNGDELLSSIQSADGTRSDKKKVSKGLASIIYVVNILESVVLFALLIFPSSIIIK